MNALTLFDAPALPVDDEGSCTRGDYFFAPVLARRERLALLASGPAMDARPGSPAHERGLRDADAARLHLAAVLAMEHGTWEAWETLNYWLEWEREP